MVESLPTSEEVWSWLAGVADPEIPVLSVVDLGIVRDVRVSCGTQGPEVAVTITPTYCGCPAMEVIERDIGTALRSRGFAAVRVETRLSPAWTTDWMSAAGREKLRAYGIAPPSLRACGREADENPACPRCGSVKTELLSRFGSTPCKAVYRCTSCLEPFDAFKCH